MNEKEETDIVLEEMERERREREKRKREEATIIMLYTELEGCGYPPDGDCYRYDFGGDEWIDSISGADTWYREHQNGLEKSKFQ
jgi:hypothetical protein